MSYRHACGVAGCDWSFPTVGEVFMHEELHQACDLLNRALIGAPLATDEDFAWHKQASDFVYQHGGAAAGASATTTEDGDGRAQ